MFLKLKKRRTLNMINLRMMYILKGQEPKYIKDW